MIIDVHTHTFPEHIASSAIAGMEQDIVRSQGIIVKAPGSGKYNDLVKKTIESNIDMTLVAPVATKPAQAQKINQLSAITNEKSDETHVFYTGAIHPDCDNYKEILDDVKSMGLKGIKLHPDYQSTLITDKKYLNIIDYASNKDLVILIHAGEDIGLPETIHCTPDMILDMWKHVQPPKMVLAHMAGWRLWDEVEEKLMDLPVYFDTAVCLRKEVPHLENEQFVRMVRKHGADRILFGTDWPWYSQKAAIEDINKTDLTESEKKLIFGENANKLYQLL